MQPEIKEALTEDMPGMAALIAGDEAWRRYGIDQEEALDMLRDADDTFYVAKEGGQLIGFYALRLNGVGNIGGYLRMIIVAEDWRNRGIGSQLLEHAWAVTDERVPNLFLICSTDNVGAQRFYKRNGFRAVGLLDDLVVFGHQEILFRRTGGPLRP